MARVILDHITKRFGKVAAIDDLTLDIMNNELVALLGPSGCGKTTTMWTIAGLETPERGKVIIGGKDVTSLPPEKRNVSMVFQFPVVYTTLTVFDNIAFPLRARKVKIEKTQLHEKIVKASEIFELQNDLNTKMQNLDLHRRQLVAMTRAIVAQPDIYLFDEPLTALDPKRRLEYRAKLKELQHELNQTILYVTHDQSEALTLADKIGVMDKGRLLQYDTPLNIYDRPANTFVGWFIGNPGMNFINCSYEEREGRAFLNLGEVSYDVTDRRRDLKLEGDNADREWIMGIRPEMIEVDGKEHDGWIPTKCSYVENLGGVMILFLQVAGATVKAKISPELKFRTGDQVWINFPSEQIHIFDRKTEQLIS